MARKKISEFRAKTLLYQALELFYEGLPINLSRDSLVLVDQLDQNKTYVVKVDEGIKRRMKKGLVALNETVDGVKKNIKEFQKKGHKKFLIEEYVSHDSSSERYLAIERVRGGYQVYYSKKGGIDIEDNQSEVQKVVISWGLLLRQLTDRNDKVTVKITKDLGLSTAILERLLEAFDTYYFSFLEINPFLILDTKYLILDTACEVDSAAEFFSGGAWSTDDFVTGETKEKTIEEQNIEKLSSKSQASFKLDVLNPNGSVFMLLSGGGASIVLADEVANLGFGKELANYGEYSGNPNEEETYLYTKNLLHLLLKSSAKNKVLIIAGGVANFTDVRITFRGIIKAIDEVKDRLQEQKVKVFVRRGGPYQEEGLAQMRDFLQKEKLFGEVVGPEMVLTNIVAKAIKYLG